MIQQKNALLGLSCFLAEVQAAVPVLKLLGLVMIPSSSIHHFLSAFKNLSYELALPSECSINSCAGDGSACVLCGHCYSKKSCRDMQRGLFPSA